MDKRQQAKIMKQVKRDRAARREVEIQMGLPRVTGGVHKTTKKDRSNRKRVPNKVRNWEQEI